MKTIETTAKITVVAGAVNPFREGTKVWKRAEAVIKSKRVELALAKGARLRTVRKLVELRIVRVAA